MVEAVSQGRWVWKAPKGYRNTRHHGKERLSPIEDRLRSFGALGCLPTVVTRLARSAMDQHSGIPIMTQECNGVCESNLHGKNHRLWQKFMTRLRHLFPSSLQNSFGCKDTLRSKPKARLTNRHSNIPPSGSVLCQCGSRLTAYCLRDKQTYAYYGCLQMQGLDSPP